jgi:hypothetical protein
LRVAVGQREEEGRWLLRISRREFVRGEGGEKEGWAGGSWAVLLSKEGSGRAAKEWEGKKRETEVDAEGNHDKLESRKARADVVY